MATRIHPRIEIINTDDPHSEASDPFLLRSSVYSPMDDGLFVRFVDEVVGFIPIERIVPRWIRDQALFDQMAVVENGYTLSIPLRDDDGFTMDYLALRSLVDEHARQRVAQFQIRSATQVGQRIRKARQKKGWTQTEFEVQTGIGQALISKMERGQHYPRAETLDKIARALSVPVFSLMMAGPSN